MYYLETFTIKRASQTELRELVSGSGVFNTYVGWFPENTNINSPSMIFSPPMILTFHTKGEMLYFCVFREPNMYIKYPGTRNEFP